MSGTSLLAYVDGLIAPYITALKSFLTPASVAITLPSGWTNVGGSNAQAYATKYNNVVVSKGLITGAASAINTIICTLPTGMVPTDGLRYFNLPMYNGTSWGSIQVSVNTSGNVTILAATSTTTQIDLSSIVFSTL